MAQADTKTGLFKWNSKRSEAALSLATGETQAATAESVGVSLSSIKRWCADPEFSAEVDRLTHMVSIASRAERLRIAMRVARQKQRADGGFDTDKDLLDWLKFAQSETDGVKLDLTTILQQYQDSE